MAKNLWYARGNSHTHPTHLTNRRQALPEVDPDVADEVLWSDRISPYDEAHFVTYMRLLDAEADGANWQEVAQIVLHRDPVAEPERTRHCWEDHLRRAKWMTESGYRKILTGDRDRLQ